MSNGFKLFVKVIGRRHESPVARKWLWLGTLAQLKLTCYKVLVENIYLQFLLMDFSTSE